MVYRRYRRYRRKGGYPDRPYRVRKRPGRVIRLVGRDFEYEGPQNYLQRSRRRIGIGARVGGISGGFTGMPRRLKIKFHASDMILNQGGVGYNEIRLNNMSIADPFHDASATVPRHKSQLGTIYNNYVVYGCKISITFINASTTVPCRIVVVPVPDATAFSSLDEAKEYPGGSYRLLPVTGTADERKLTINRYVDSAHALHVTKSQLHNDNQYHGLGFGVNPVTTSFVKICFSPVDVAETTDVDLDVEMTFYTEVYDLIRLADD